MALTAREVATFQPSKKVRRVNDGGGLYLEIRPSGSKLWIFRWRKDGKLRGISLGPYPEVSLKEARIRRDEARRKVRLGLDPSQRTEAAKGETLEELAREWWGIWRTDKADVHSGRVLRALERDIFPRLGSKRAADLEPVDILPALRAVEERGAIETAHRIRYTLGMVFRYGVASGRCQRDPTADLKGALRPVVEGHLAAVTDVQGFGELLRAIDGYQGQPVTTWALRLAPLVALRPGELRRAEWAEIDLDRATWIVPASKMKLRRDHVVPLSKQAVGILEEAHALTGRGRYVFPGVRSPDRPISDNTLTAALRRLGYTTEDATTHGFRASFRTIGAEVLGFRPELLEHQLAHAVRDPLGRAYNRTEFLDERRDMMQRWADWCDEIKQPSAARQTA